MVESDQITPHLNLIRLLGQPEASRIWLARDTKLGQDVAVKVLRVPLARNSAQLHRFHREAEVAAQIKSPHVARVLAQGISESGLPYLEMELLEGTDLATRLQRDGSLPLSDVARIVGQLSQGLAKAHMLGLIHRNLKPTNIFLVNTPEGSFDVKVLDVGLSSGSDLTRSSRASMDMAAGISLPEYASPEQVFGVKDVDLRADLWAIAVVAYEALTGRRPFSGASPEAFVQALEQTTFDPPSRFVPSLPASVDAWFLKAFQRDPLTRFGGAKELGDEFQRAARGDAHERTSGTSTNPPMAGQRSSIRAGENSSPRLSVTSSPSMPPQEGVTVIGVGSKGRTSSSLIVAVMAIVGIGTVLAGLSLLNH